MAYIYKLIDDYITDQVIDQLNLKIMDTIYIPILFQCGGSQDITEDPTLPLLRKLKEEYEIT